MVKIEKIMKLPAYRDCVGIPKFIYVYDFENFVKAHTGYHPVAGLYKLSISYKVRKRRKLKKVVVDYYNLHTCDCCGPYYMAEIQLCG